MDDLANENKNNQNWIGKEKDKENGLGDHGVRKYEYETGRFTSIDPLWNNYYGWTPYQYSLNSPISFKDDGGLLVEVVESLQDNVKNMVSPEFRDYIKFDDNNIINKELISSADVDPFKNPIMFRLKTVALSEEFAVMKNTIDGKMIAKRTDTGEKVFLDLNNTNFDGHFGGYTLFPEEHAADGGVSSTVNHTVIYINDTMSEGSQTQTIGPELLIHFYYFIIGKPYFHNINNVNDALDDELHFEEQLIKDDILQNVKK